MKVALIGDVHANLHALEATLGAIHDHDIEAIWDVGDIVGYGAFPDEVVHRLRKEQVLSVVGNLDRKVLAFKQNKADWRKKKRAEEYQALKWAYESLSKKNRKFLRFLSREIRMKVKGRRVLVTHGSPDSDKEGLTQDTSTERLRELAHMAKAEVIVCGHSHVPFVREVEDVWFINPGSVGMPGDGDPRASYAVVRFTSGQIEVQHFRVEYDVEAAADAIRERGLPGAFARMITEGRSLKAVLAE
jgi:putative phosphoesterase